ncbi:MAG: 3-phosphoshikimate 1-carboxyvinyltransferase [Rhodobacteraceae bacterium]|nr:3-phosphoshikimate 1-carboxyvinyltransferase [Paracoccaceae bacterium]
MASGGAPQPLISRKSGPLRGSALGPGDKSISHRALILGGLAVGESRIEGLLEGEDVLRTADAMRAFGADIERLGAGSWRVRGVGVGALAEPEDVIDFGNSGTGVRLVMGLAATHPVSATFTGDASLRRRPMARVLDPLSLFGAQSMGRSGGRLPLTMRGSRAPMPVEYETPMASAQVKSAVLLAGLNTPGDTVVIERESTRDHSERMLRAFGAAISTEVTPEGKWMIRLCGQPELTPQSVTVARDPSSAAFPTAAAVLVEGSELLLPAIGANPTRFGFYETLREMGASVDIENHREEGGEPVVDVRARFSALKGIETPPERAPSMIDEYPILAVVAAFAEGTSIFHGVSELRVKETDRIAATAKGLAACGVSVEEKPDTLIVHGAGPQGVPGGGTVAAELDHRIAMSFAMLGLAAQNPVTIDDGAPIATSFPGFTELMRGLGADLAMETVDGSK